MLEMRTARAEDIDCIMEIYAAAQDYMIASGNPTQWRRTNPARELIEADVAAGRCRDLLGVRENTAFDPVRPRPPAMSELRDAEAGALIAADPRWGRIVCTCKQVSEAEILRAIHAAPPCTTVDGVKRRTGCCLGTCQGSRCTEKIVGLLSRELGVPVSEIAKDGDGSWIIR